MILKGQISYMLRDAITLDVIEEGTVDNVITEAFYDALNKDMDLSIFGLCINGKSLNSSRWTTTMPGNNNGNIALVPNSAIPGVSTKTTFPQNGDTPFYFQFAGRYNPPVSETRVIKTVMLISSSTSQGTVDGTAPVPLYAYTSLNIPCSQTSAQVLDVYYRVFFPKDASTQTHLLDELITRYQYSSGNAALYNNSSIFPTPVVTNLKSGDENRSATGVAAMMYAGASNSYNIASVHVISGPYSGSGSYKYIQQIHTFDDLSGMMCGSILTGGKLTQAHNGTKFAQNSYDDYSPVVLSATNLKVASKIQNTIGHGTSAVPNTASPYLDVDNLPSGSGKVIVSGAWANHSSPLSAGLYYKSLVPQFNSIQVSETGKISDGLAKYTYFEQPFFGFRNVPNPSTTAQPSYYFTRSSYTIGVLPSLCATTPVVGSTDTGNWRCQTYDAGKTIVEEITADFLEGPQISASCKYDEGSFILVKKNKIILYNIGAGDYWKFNGPYTQIHQVAVVEGKIYVACRNTGLYVIDPVNSLDVVSLSAPEAGIDLSKCYGVAKGFNNSVWAVGHNGLMCLQAGMWSKYDSASASPFTMAGVSDSKWYNIEYLKVDEESPAYEMFLVRKYNADTDATSFGVWWSPASGATNAFNLGLFTQPGYPRFNRTHFGGLAGMWAMSIGGWQYVMAFKGAMTVVAGSVAMTSTKLTDIYASIFFVKNSLGQPRLMSMVDNIATGPSGNMRWVQVKLIDAAAQVTDTVVSGLVYSLHTSGATYNNNDPFGHAKSRARGSLALGTSYNDCAASIILDNGVMVTLWCGTDSGWLNNNTNGSVVTGKIDNLIVGVSNYALDGSLSGGPLAYLARKNYGWTGTMWDQSVTTPKPMHLTDESLKDGVLVRFEEGAVNNSFVNPNYYRFTLSEGLAKDNATRSYIFSKFHPRKIVKNAELSAYIIPASAPLPTGIVGVDTTRSSTGVYLDGQNRMHYPLEAGAAYGVGDKQLNGDFEISFNLSGMSSTAAINSGMMFGVGKHFSPFMSFFGFRLLAQVLYTQMGDVTTNTSIALASVGSLSIKRVGGVMTTLVNGVVKTTCTAAAGIYTRCRLDVVTALPNSSTVLNAIADRMAPAITIVSNGSDSMLTVGHVGNKTGAFGARFNGLADNPVVTIDGVLAPVSAVEPIPAGSVYHTNQSGYIHFSPDDAGKIVTSSANVYQSE